MAYTYSKIATVTVGSGGSSSIDFLAIPQNYTDLLLVTSCRDTGAGAENSIAGIFNGDTAGNYSNKLLRGNGSTAASGTTGSTSLWMGQTQGSGTTSNTFTNSSVYIPNYTSSNYKSISVDSTEENNGTANYMFIYSGLWTGTAAINRISLTTPGGNFAQYSSATLYGIKAEV